MLSENYSLGSPSFINLLCKSLEWERMHTYMKTGLKVGVEIRGNKTLKKYF